MASQLDSPSIAGCMSLPEAGPYSSAESPGKSADCIPLPALWKRVLIADVDRDAVSRLSLLFGMLGNTVRTAYNDIQAIATVREFDPDLVLLGISMNSGEGCRSTYVLLGSCSPSARVVALVGYAEEGRHAGALAWFDQILYKPVSERALVGMLYDGNQRR